jgi:tetratricopeptide (TPR) repeat protein
MPEESVLLKYKYWVLGTICLLTFICFNYSLHNQFTNWDDDVYVTNDTVIRTLNATNLKTIFTEDITKNNYHPFCMLSLGINYQFAKLAPATYYLTNILIHIANVALVFFLIMQLCKHIKLKQEESFLMAAFVALWFGIHPLHVESVSWIAERKDVLYTFFYLLGLLTYLKYLSTPLPTINSQLSIKDKWLVLTFILFVFSCLSKPMAVVFPLSMLAIDYLFGRKIEMKLLTQKSLFFLAALFFGGYAYYTQNRTGAIADFSKLTIMERLMYASYGFDMYLYKLINPSFLSTFYPYPYRYIDGSLPFIYYAAPFIAISIVAAPLYIAYKLNRTYFTIIAFAYGFFIANVIFVLQFISCGAAIMADRYSYVSSIGIFFALAYFINELIKRFPNIKAVALTVLLFLSGILAYGCYQRTKVWHNAETLYKDAIGKYPYRALLSYKWLGYYYMDQHDTDKAAENFEVLAKINAGDAKIYDVLGNIYRDRKDYKNALELYNRSLKEQNNIYITYVDRSLAYMQAGDSADARKDYAQALALNHEQAIQSYGKLASQNAAIANTFNELGSIAHSGGGPYMTYLDSSFAAAEHGDSTQTIRYYLLAISKSPVAEKVYSEKSFAMVQAKQYLPVIEQYKALLLVNPNNPYYYFYKGVAEFGAGSLNKAINDFKAALKFNIKEVSVVAAFNLATICDSVNDDKNALIYANMATQMGHAPTPEFVQKIKDKAAGKK